MTRVSRLAFRASLVLLAATPLAAQPASTCVPVAARPLSRGHVLAADDIATRGQSTQPEELGRIELARFSNPAGLQAQGENLYVATAASGDAVTGFPQEDGFGRTVQGAVEASNVEIVQEMVDMITAMRAYEINSKAIKNSEEMLEIANNLVR